jgi:hypothetical protein
VYGEKVTKNKGGKDDEAEDEGEIIGADEEENIDELKVGVKRGREAGEQLVDRR